MRKINNKKGQVWVETVIYTLIGLVLIGTVLAFATPFINEQRDKAVIERTAESLNVFDNTILNVNGKGIGNSREISYLMGKGVLEIDPVTDQIIFTFDKSRHQFSELGITVDASGSNLKIRTEELGDDFGISLILDYEDRFDIVYDFEEGVSDGTSNQIFDSAPNPYRFIVQNLGRIPEPLLCTSGAPCTTPTIPEGTCNSGGTSCVPDKTKINIYDIS
jgi:type II secretory pathway pseudopilin PulG